MDWGDWLLKGILSLEFGFFAFCVVALIVLAFRRVKKRRSETFEKRDH
jgi:membrane protein implicated in regulation of membrane protease activity